MTLWSKQYLILFKESDSLSKSNTFEAKFLVGLCRYLILQGYGPERITILTTYLGQMFAVKKLIYDIQRYWN